MQNYLEVQKMAIKLPEGITVSTITSDFNLAVSEYSTAHRRAKQLDMIDKCKLWASMQAKFPKYQILPDTNHVAYVKNNILASIYTVGKSARLLPTSKEDKDIVEQVNVAMESLWATLNVPYYQLLAGERASLMNLGITQVGWDNTIVGGTKDAFFKGNVRLKNINPLKYMRDPYADSLELASWCCTWDDFHESVLAQHSGYQAEFKILKASGQLSTDLSTITIAPASDRLNERPNANSKYHRVYTYFIRKQGVGTKDGVIATNICEVHLLDNKFPLLVKENIKPAIFPFVELYCNIPSGDLLGISEPAKIAANSLAYNIMNSIVLTADYKNQRPPRFVNVMSQLNVNAFTKYGNDADRTFPVQGDASKAVHYHQFPQVSQAALTSMSVLASDTQLVSGVDGRYTGRDTGSVLTTGGISNMLDQVTMIDAPKVINYEMYAKQLTQLIVYNYIEHSIKRTFYIKNKTKAKTYDAVEVGFDDIPGDIIFNYELAISSELPKNKTRIEAFANKLMEMQMQYKGAGVDVDLITPEEWLMMQDVPNREFMLERMGIQRTSNWYALVAQAITQYGGMLDNGVDPDKALQATAETLAQQTQPGGTDLQDVATQTQIM